MSDKDKEIDLEKFDIGSIGDPKDPDVLLVAIPIKFLAKKGPDGMDEAIGKCRRIEAVVSKFITQYWNLKKLNGIQPGVILPNGKPAQVIH